MPRVDALKDNYRQYDTSQLIRGFQAREGKTQSEMAEILGISQPAYHKKLVNVEFSLRDIQRLYIPLHLSRDEIVWLVTGKETE